MTGKNNETPALTETELRREARRATLTAMESHCKNIINSDEPDTGQLVDQTLRYLRVIRAEIKRLVRLSEAPK